MRHCLDQLCKSLRLYVIPLRQGQPRSHFASVKSEENIEYRVDIAPSVFKLQDIVKFEIVNEKSVRHSKCL